MKVAELTIPDVKIIEPQYYEDYRGYFVEAYSARTLSEYGLNRFFVQDNHIHSLKAGTLRGIHFQNDPMSQTKLARCIKGEVLDVVVDLRKDSPYYKKWCSVILSAENHKQIWIPAGFGHAFLSLVDNCEFIYKVDAFHSPEYDRSIAWNDPEINVDWPVDNPIVSLKDMQAPLLKDSDVNFKFEWCFQ